MTVDVMVLDPQLKDYLEMGFLEYKEKYGQEAIDVMRIEKHPLRWSHFWLGLGDWICERFQEQYKAAEDKTGLFDGFWVGPIILKPSNTQYLLDCALDELKGMFKKRLDARRDPPPRGEQDLFIAEQLRLEKNLMRFIPVLLEALRHGYDIDLST